MRHFTNLLETLLPWYLRAPKHPEEVDMSTQNDEQQQPGAIYEQNDTCTKTYNKAPNAVSYLSDFSQRRREQLSCPILILLCAKIAVRREQRQWRRRGRTTRSAVVGPLLNPEAEAPLKGGGTLLPAPFQSLLSTFAVAVTTASSLSYSDTMCLPATGATRVAAASSYSCYSREMRRCSQSRFAWLRMSTMAWLRTLIRSSSVTFIPENKRVNFHPSESSLQHLQFFPR